MSKKPSYFEAVGEQSLAHRLLLTVRDVSELTGFSVGSLYHFVSQRRIPFVRFSDRCIRFRRSDIDAWIEELRVARDEAAQNFYRDG